MTLLESMALRRRAGLALLVTVAAGGCVPPQTARLAGPAPAAASTAVPFEEAARRARALAAALRESRGLPGLAVAVAMGGQVLLAEGFGWADAERALPLTGAGQLRIGSVSKLLTITAAVRLEQAGRLDLDAPISKYLPGLSRDKGRLTVRVLAAHLGGVRHYRGGESLNHTHYEDVTASLPRFLADPVLAPPRTSYQYSSYGYNLIGGAIQGAAGTEFRQVVAEQVLDPLGMNDTVAEDARQPPPRLVRLYARDSSGSLVDAPATDLSDRWPSGGYVSSVADLVRFGAGVIDTGFLEKGRREEMFIPQRTADGGRIAVGLGWRIARDPSGRRYVHHSGEAVGGRAFLLVYPDHRLVVALAANLTFAPIELADVLGLAEPFLRRR